MIKDGEKFRFTKYKLFTFSKEKEYDMFVLETLTGTVLCLVKNQVS